MTGEHNYVGQPVRRCEDEVLITGRGRYAGDLRFPGMLHMAVARSTVPHGVLTSVNLDAARSVPGVVGAFAAADLGELHGVIVDTTLPDLRAMARSSSRQMWRMSC